jgi:hypothetical protein
MTMISSSLAASPFNLPAPSSIPTRFGMALTEPEDKVTVGRSGATQDSGAIAMKLVMFKVVADLIVKGEMHPEQVTELQINITVALLKDPKLLEAAQAVPELQKLPLVAMVLNDPEMAPSLLRFLEHHGLEPSDLPSLIDLTNRVDQVLRDFEATKKK